MIRYDIRVMVAKKISLQEALLSIEQAIGPFKLQFAKSDGTLREMVCMKRNRNKSADKKTPHPKSFFRWSLQEKYALILDELVLPLTKTQVPGLGTVMKLPEGLRIDQINTRTISRAPKTPNIFSLRMYNDQLIYTIK